MIADIWTMVWKEWKELLLAHGTKRGGLMRLVIMLGIFGGMLPLQTGRAWVESPVTLFYWAWVPLFLVVGVIADSFAGERERHTLETLLASRMPDRAILFGKVAAAVGYGWGLAMVSLLVGLVVINVAHGQGQLLLYKPEVALGGTALSLLASLLAAGGGVLVSLRAATVRQAAQTMSIAMMVLFLLPTVVVGMLPRLLPASFGEWLQAFLLRANWTAVLVGAGVVLAVIDLGLLSAAMARFRRARLILD